MTVRVRKLKREFEAVFKASAKQPGTGNPMPPSMRIAEAAEAEWHRYLRELEWRSKSGDPHGPPHHLALIPRPSFDIGRKLAAQSNRSKAEPLREQISTIWKQLPPHLLNATQVHQRLKGFSVDVRTVRRHLLALKLTKP